MLPKDEGDNRNATQKLKICVDPSLAPSTLKDTIKLKDDVDIATETIPKDTLRHEKDEHNTHTRAHIFLMWRQQSV